MEGGFGIGPLHDGFEHLGGTGTGTGIGPVGGGMYGIPPPMWPKLFP